MAHAGDAGQERAVSVFSSDDDLSSFLAGLRAKYASLYPQYPEDGNAIGNTDGEIFSVAAVGSGTAADGPVPKAASGSLEQKICQLRSSLQSLQSLLPPRTSTTANLLDSFIAVSGEHSAHHASTVAEATQERQPEPQGPADEPHPTSPSGVESPAGHQSATNSAAARSSGADPACAPASPMGAAMLAACDRPLPADPDSAQAAFGSTFVTAGATMMTATDTAGSPTHGGRESAAGQGSSVPAVDDAASDAAFVELAAGYSRRTLQPPSSEASESSLGARESEIPEQPCAQDGPQDEFWRRDSPTRAGSCDGQAAGRAWELRVAAQERGDRGFRPPMAAVFGQGSLYATVFGPEDAAVLPAAGAEAAQHVAGDLVPPAGGASCSGVGREGSAGPWRLDGSGSPGVRRRGWHLPPTGVVGPAAGGSYAADRAAGSGGAATAAGDRELNWAPEPIALAAAWGPSSCASAGENGLAATRESSAAWDSLDEATTNADEGHAGEPGGGGSRRSRRESGTEAPPAGTADRETRGVLSADADGSGFCEQLTSQPGSLSQGQAGPERADEDGLLGEWLLRSPSDAEEADAIAAEQPGLPSGATHSEGPRTGHVLSGPYVEEAGQQKPSHASGCDQEQLGVLASPGEEPGAEAGGQLRQRRRWESPVRNSTAAIPAEPSATRSQRSPGRTWFEEGGAGAAHGPWQEGAGAMVSSPTARLAQGIGTGSPDACAWLAPGKHGHGAARGLELGGWPSGSAVPPPPVANANENADPRYGALMPAHDTVSVGQAHGTRGHTRRPQHPAVAVGGGPVQRSLRLLPPPHDQSVPPQQLPLSDAPPCAHEDVLDGGVALLSTSSPANDEVLCGSPSDPAPAAPAELADDSTAAGMPQGEWLPWSNAQAEAAVVSSVEAGAREAAAVAAAEGSGQQSSCAPVNSVNVGPGRITAAPCANSDSGAAAGGGVVSSITAGRGGVAFSISVHTAAAKEGHGPAGSVGPGQPLTPWAQLHGASESLAGAGGPPDWDKLNRQLREAGFGGLVMAQLIGQPSTTPAPEPSSLYRCLSSVLEQYVRRNRLVSELLAATEQSGRVAEQQEAAMRELQREVNAARSAAERARRELADVSSQQLPKAEARHASQVNRLRSEVAKLKEALREAELDSGTKVEEIRSLRATITGLQSTSSHSSDVEGAALRQRVAQLEGLLRARDKEVEKLKATKDSVVGQAEDGQANALDRAYEAEGAARRLEMELTGARTRIGQLEQALRQREREVSTMREDLQQIKACEAAATLVAQERGAAAEEAARRAEGEAAALRGKVKEMEAVLRAARQELEKQRTQAEALRSSAYEEVYRLEDERRTLSTDLQAAQNRVTQLEHVVRAKEREVARAKDEKDAAKAAERERARVAEDVSVKLDSELTATKVKLTQVEGALRTRERELARLAELLRQTQGAEVEAWLKQAKMEEGSRKLENDFTSLRLRLLQLEAALKGRDKECDKLSRTVEALRSEAHELTSKLSKSEEAARKAEAELTTARGKGLSLEGQVRVKEREQERLVRVVEGLKAAGAEVASRQAALEDAARRLDGQLTAARSRVSALEGVVRARDAAVERLNRQLEAHKTAEFERMAQAAKSEEAARQQDAEAAALRQRVVQLESQLRTKERELERSARQVDAARLGEADAARRLADAGAAVTRLEGEVAAGRQRAVQLGEALRGRERELAVLTRALEVQRSAEHEANAAAGRTEEAARRLDGEAAELRQRLVQMDSLLRSREREAERQARALEAAQTVSAEAAVRQAEAEATVRRLEGDLVALRQRLAQAEGAVRARERDVERLEKQAEQAKGAEVQAEVKQRTAEAAATQADSELQALRSRISQLEAAARGHSKEVDRLTRVVDQSKAAEVGAARRAQRSDEAARQVAAELASARNRLSKLEAGLAAREAEMQRLQRLLAAAEAQAAAQVSRSDDFVRRVDGDLAAMRQQATQLAQLIRNRDRQLSTLRGALEAAQAAEANASGQRRQCEEAMRKVEADLVAERQRAAQLDGQVKARERDIERLSRQIDAGRDQTNTVTVTAGKEAAALKDAATRAEAALATARARVTQLESELVAKERQLEGLQRLAGYSRAGDAEAAAAAEERAGRAEEAARRLDVELANVRMRSAQLEHAFRAREAELDKLRAALAEKVAREERRLARDKAAYGRIRAAFVSTMASGAAGGAAGTPSSGAAQQQRAAGAMAAAARELRPAEIVGLYESRREAAEQELAVCRAEVRSLSDQLRDAQNLITLKDRSGAWRTPQELADMQARVIMLERRCADLQRELDRARSEAAEAARAAERRLAEVERRAVHLKEDNEALVHELDSRPTLQENRALKRELEVLEKRLLHLKGSAVSNGAGAEAESGETALSLAVAGKARGPGALLTNAQRMARDRGLHRLGLRVLEDWPKDVLVDLLQDACIELDVSDATSLPAAVRKTLRVVGAVPRMEAFIGAVCENVYRKGASFVPPHIDGTTDPSRVLEVLEVWLGLLQEGAQLKGVMRAIVEALSSRAEGMALPIHGPGDVLASIRQLVEAEAVALTARESLAAAAEHMAAHPEQVLSRLVAHFMRLFDCPSLEGVVPAVNRLYVTLNEQRNFVRALTTALGLPGDAGITACMSKVREVVEGVRGSDAAAVITCMARHGGDAETEHSKQGYSPGTCPLAALPVQPAGVNVEVSTAIERLLALFGVQTAMAVAEAAEKALARLRRLDEVLPRYQRLASQLFEVLRCTSLEEIMPAVKLALQRPP